MIVINRGIIWFLALLLCAAFWAAVLYPLVAHSQPAPTPVTGSASVSDAAYGNDWNGDTENAPSKNAVFDKIETISAGGGSVTINTTSPMTGAGTGSTFTLGVNQSLMSLSSIGGAVTDSQVPDDITITALTGKQNISSLETDVEAIADLQDLQGAVTDDQVPNNITVDLATTATTASALTTNPTACGAGEFVNDIAANGTLICGTPSGGGGGVGIGTVNPGSTNAISKYVSSTTLDDSAFIFEVGGNVGLGTSTPAGGLVILNGNVGLGTVSPGSGLTIRTGTGISLGSNSAAPSGGIITTGNVGIGTTSLVGGFVVMNGNAGIGTWSPNSKLQVVGTLDATTVTGANVTSGANPGHTHTTTSISGLDISDDTNLAGTANEVVLTGDTLSLADAVKGWVDGGTTVYNATSTDAIGIGTTAARSGFEFDLRGDQYVSGNVGIGTTTVPGVPLYVGGAIKTSEIQGTSAAGTPFTITQANIGIGTSAAGAAVVIGNSPSHTSVGLCIGTGGCVGYCTGALGTCSACTCLTTQ